MKSGVPSVTKHASRKPSRQCFSGNGGNSSSGSNTDGTRTYDATG